MASMKIKLLAQINDTEPMHIGDVEVDIQVVPDGTFKIVDLEGQFREAFRNIE